MNQKQNNTQNNKAFAFFSFLAVLTVGISSVWGSSIHVKGQLTGNHIWDVDTVFLDSTTISYLGSHLTIAPGTRIVANKDAILYLGNEVDIEGTKEDSIHFTAANTTDGWGGIQITNANGPLRELKYVTISHASGRGLEIIGDTKISHSRISHNKGGGIWVNSSHVDLTHLHIHSNNSASRGGYIFH